MPGQAQIGDDDVEGEIGQRSIARSPESAWTTSNPRSVKPLGDRLAQRRFVFDEQQMFRCVSHLAASVF